MKFAKYFTPILAAAALAACDSGTSSNASRVTIRLHDAPGDLAEAWVKVDRVYLMGTSAADSTSGRVDLLTTPTGWINLTDLTGGSFSTIVNGVAAPAGSYTQLRIVVCEAYVVTESGDVYSTTGATLPAGVTSDGQLRTPSGCQSGFKVKLPGGSVTLENDAEVFSVDFDVSQSFGHVAGNSGAWVMHPVMTATDIQFMGSISGIVSLATGVTFPTCGGAATDVTKFSPLAISALDSLSAVVGTDGAYALGVAPGTYTMSYVPALSFTNGDSLLVTAAPSVPSATVASGGSTTVNYSVSAVTCKPHA
jgi:hypothetical protein